MNGTKQSTSPDELERQICSTCVPKSEREWWAHYEIEKLRDRLAVETLALVETLSRAERAEQEVVALRAEVEQWKERAYQIAQEQLRVAIEELEHADEEGDKP